jgi:rod shape-determining protein MreC
VATVARVERDAANSFAHILCQPLAGIERGRYVLLLEVEARVAPNPEAAAPEPQPRGGKPRRVRRKAADGG